MMRNQESGVMKVGIVSLDPVRAPSIYSVHDALLSRGYPVLGVHARIEKQEKADRVAEEGRLIGPIEVHLLDLVGHGINAATFLIERMHIPEELALSSPDPCLAQIEATMGLEDDPTLFEYSSLIYFSSTDDREAAIASITNL